jgi:hypothetical protein
MGVPKHEQNWENTRNMQDLEKCQGKYLRPTGQVFPEHKEKFQDCIGKFQDTFQDIFSLPLFGTPIRGFHQTIEGAKDLKHRLIQRLGQDVGKLRLRGNSMDTNLTIILNLTDKPK